MAGVMAVLVSMLGLSLVVAQQGPNASRSFDEASVAPGGQVMVTIAASGYGGFGAVTETLPAGFSYVSSSIDADQVIAEGQAVSFTPGGEQDLHLHGYRLGHGGNP